MSSIILFRGKAGTGKTTLSNALARRLRVPVLHKDDLYDSAAAFVADHQARNEICFQFLYRFLQHAIESKATVMLDFGLNHLDAVRELKNWIEARGGELKTFVCICSDESLWSERLAERSANPLPNQLITNLADLKEHYRSIHDGYLDGEMIVDSSMPQEVLIEHLHAAVMEHFGSRIRHSVQPTPIGEQSWTAEGGKAFVEPIIANMTEERAREVLSWTYAPPYDWYNLPNSPEALEEIRSSSYYAVVDASNRMTGFFCTGASAQVPNESYGYGGDYIDIGIGMKPELTGQGRGYSFFAAVTDYIERTYGRKPQRVTVADFNERAIRLYAKCGFRAETSFTREAMAFLTMLRHP